MIGLAVPSVGHPPVTLSTDPFWLDPRPSKTTLDEGGSNIRSVGSDSPLVYYYVTLQKCVKWKEKQTRYLFLSFEIGSWNDLNDKP